ncbi:hypothetical protein OWV82_008681 [Melia azedarach]|uniref:Uncharacterized protein n=1 Tax=Melia azedarach TaxID=155640 RepID=A0ACC1YBZ9_MELAZ|nr:hypothetical protein OWV82_008681 [Melia azedarach]
MSFYKPSGLSPDGQNTLPPYGGSVFDSYHTQSGRNFPTKCGVFSGSSGQCSCYIAGSLLNAGCTTIVRLSSQLKFQ